MRRAISFWVLTFISLTTPAVGQEGEITVYRLGYLLKTPNLISWSTNLSESQTGCNPFERELNWSGTQTGSETILAGSGTTHVFLCKKDGEWVPSVDEYLFFESYKETFAGGGERSVDVRRIHPYSLASDGTFTTWRFDFSSTTSKSTTPKQERTTTGGEGRTFVVNLDSGGGSFQSNSFRFSKTIYSEDYCPFEYRSDRTTNKSGSWPGSPENLALSTNLSVVSSPSQSQLDRCNLTCDAVLRESIIFDYVRFCWDLNKNGERDLDEDKNGDGVVDYDDCEETRSRQAIELIFRPGYNLSLRQTAALCGFDHFNWINLAVSDTDEICANQSAPDRPDDCDDLRQQRLDAIHQCAATTCTIDKVYGSGDEPGIFPVPPYIDPPAGGFKYMAVRYTKQWPGADDLAYYCDEYEEFDPGAGIGLYCLDQADQNDRGSPDPNKVDARRELWFYDAPSGGTVLFHTTLAGVRPDKSGENLGKKYKELGRKWRYNGSTGDIEIIKSADKSHPGRNRGSIEVLGTLEDSDFTPDIIDLLASYGVDVPGAEGECPEGTSDLDNDGVPDECDDDIDGDGVPNDEDAFPDDPTESSDNDADGVGDNADTDDDNDGQSDTDEVSCGSDPLVAESMSADWDGDNSPDCVDPDDDNDLVDDVSDHCPSTVIPEAVPVSSSGLGANRWALHSESGAFIQAPPQANSLYAIDTSMTRGCSCEQIIEKADLGEGHTKYGCATGEMLEWINQ